MGLAKRIAECDASVDGENFSGLKRFLTNLSQRTPLDRTYVQTTQQTQGKEQDLITSARVQQPGLLAQHIGFLYVQGHKEPFGTMKALKQLQPYDGRIIECTLNEKGEWVFMRERTDKSLPNGYDTAVAVLNSMKFPISQEALCEYIEKVEEKEKKPMRSSSRCSSSGDESEPPAKRSNTSSNRAHFNN